MKSECDEWWVFIIIIIESVNPCVQISEGQLDFFPLLDALALETEDDETSAKLDELREMVESVLERFKKEVGVSYLRVCIV